mmetsp:Transcript_65678/g.181360  ORF Transcript_65678/g.181360 Transcript_65678/m.181360 type:complete len:156 (+) Transcript_65678:1061-1528(+)
MRSPWARPSLHSRALCSSLAKVLRARCMSGSVFGSWADAVANRTALRSSRGSPSDSALSRRSRAEPERKEDRSEVPFRPAPPSNAFMSKSRSSACRLHGAPARPPLEHAEGEEETFANEPTEGLPSNLPELANLRIGEAPTGGSQCFWGRSQPSE